RASHCARASRDRDRSAESWCCPFSVLDDLNRLDSVLVKPDRALASLELDRELILIDDGPEVYLSRYGCDVHLDLVAANGAEHGALQKMRIGFRFGFSFLFRLSCGFGFCFCGDTHCAALLLRWEPLWDLRVQSDNRRARKTSVRTSRETLRESTSDHRSAFRNAGIESLLPSPHRNRIACSRSKPLDSERNRIRGGSLNGRSPCNRLPIANRTGPHLAARHGARGLELR